MQAVPNFDPKDIKLIPFLDGNTADGEDHKESVEEVYNCGDGS